MFDRLLAHLAAVTPAATPDTVAAPFSRRDLAVAVLLLEVAQCDGAITADETAAIAKVMRERLGLDERTAAALIAAARREFAAALDDWIFAAQVRDAFDADERLAIVRAMWDLVYADGRLARLEAAMMDHVGRAVGVARAACAAARVDASARAPIAPERDPEGPA